MTSNRFFIRQADLDGPSALLKGSEHHHLAHVAHIRPNDTVWLFDEQGKIYLAWVDEVGKGPRKPLGAEKTLFE